MARWGRGLNNLYFAYLATLSALLYNCTGRSSNPLLNPADESFYPTDLLRALGA